MRRCGGGSLLLAGVSLLGACARPPGGASTLQAGAERSPHWIAVPTVTLAVANVSVSTRRPTGDTTAHAVALVTSAARPKTTDERMAVVTRDWGLPFHSNDTLTVEVKTLRPVEETLLFNGVRRTYRYDGRRVWGTIQFPDSAPQQFEETYDEPVFAFSELEALVQSLGYRVGPRVVVPLFSEVDHALEHDTLSVEERTSAHGADAWVVRFADAVITTRYVVDATSRRLLDAVTTQRRSGLQFLYHYDWRGDAR